jgi:hypothetical protein
MMTIQIPSIPIEELNRALETIARTTNIRELLSSFRQAQQLTQALNNVSLTALAPAVSLVNQLQTSVSGVITQVQQPLTQLTELGNRLETFASGLTSIASSVEEGSLEISRLAQLNQLRAGVNQLSNGIRVLSSNVPFEQMARTARNALVIGEVTNLFEPVRDQLVTELSEGARDLFSQVTGDSDTIASPASLRRVITAVNPGSLARTMERQFGVAAQELESVLSQFTEIRLESIINQALDQIDLPFREFFSEMQTFVERIDLAIGGVIQAVGIINTLVEKLSGGFQNALFFIAGQVLPPQITQTIYDLINIGSINDAFNLFASVVDNADQLEEQFRGLATGLDSFLTGTGLTEPTGTIQINPGAVTPDEAPGVPTGTPAAPTPGPDDGLRGDSTTVAPTPGPDDGLRGGSTPSWPFSMIQSEEELDALFAASTRTEENKIQALIIYSTATGRDSLVTVNDLHDGYVRNGFTGIGHHFVIERGRVRNATPSAAGNGTPTGINTNGKLFKGRPINLPGQHSPFHDVNAIGLIMVGGYEQTQRFVDTNEGQSLSGLSGFTPEQRDTLRNFIDVFIRRYPNAVVFGDRDQGGTGPGFNVIDFVRTRLDEGPTSRTRGVATRSSVFVATNGQVSGGLSTLSTSGATNDVGQEPEELI